MKAIYFLCMLFYMTTSFTQEDRWKDFKRQTNQEGAAIIGWYDSEKYLLMMDIIHENQCRQCIEIGVYAGSSLFSIMKTLQYNGSGIVHAIDAWDRCEAISGLDPNDSNTKKLGIVDFDTLYKMCLGLIDQHELQSCCNVIRKPSREAVYLFDDNSIDFIHFDGSYCVETAFQDVVFYLPKIKDNGFILLNNPHWYPMRKALVYLLERTDIISSYDRYKSYLLLRKNDKKIQNAKALMKY